MRRGRPRLRFGGMASGRGWGVAAGDPGDESSVAMVAVVVVVAVESRRGGGGKMFEWEAEGDGGPVERSGEKKAEGDVAWVGEAIEGSGKMGESKLEGGKNDCPEAVAE